MSIAPSSRDLVARCLVGAAAFAATCSASQAQTVDEVDTRCLNRIAAVSPALNLAVAHIAGHCRAAPTTAAASWLTGTPLARDLSRAFGQRLDLATSAGTALDATPRVPPEACAALAAVQAGTRTRLCTISGAGQALPQIDLEARSAQCEKGLMRAGFARVLPLAAAPEVVDVGPEDVTCLSSAEISVAGEAPQWRQLRITVHMASAALRSIDVWPMASGIRRAQ